MWLQQRYSNIWKTALLPIIDFLAIFCGSWIVFIIRYSWFEGNFIGVQKLSVVGYLPISVFVAVFVVVVYAILGLYQIYQKMNIGESILRLTFGIFLVLLSIITYLFFNEYNRQALPEGVPVSRFILATGGFFALYFVLLGRGLFWSVLQILYQFNLAKVPIAIIGKGAEELVDHFARQNQIGHIYRFPEINEQTLAEIKALMQEHKIYEIYLFGNKDPLETELAVWAERYKVAFIFAPEGFAQFQSFGLKPLVIQKKLFLELLHSNLDGWQIVLKRLFDITFAGCFLVLFSWLYLLITIAIKLDSKGDIFYLSERVGPDGRVFKIWKFRRLKQEFCTTESNKKSLEIEQKLIAERDLRKDGILYKIKDDPRTTRVGRFIEKYSLDELPQFVNVLLGSMSVVGPRPHQPREVAKYQSHHYKVLNIKPGITGFAQINGRSDLTFEQEVSYDRYYIEHWSFWLDLWIIIKTPLVVLFKKHQG